ncbi:MAG: hypothetical protein JNN00_01920 [Chitinophagaceae bacterium]|nr:hypothetical protein [Chitinophagaceae bacterium]
MRTIIILVSLALLSCQSKINTTQNTKTDFKIYPYIPDSLIAQSEPLKEMKRSADFFNLPVLYKGINDSLEIRVWPWEAFDFFKKAFVFEHDGVNWKGVYYFSYTMPIFDQDGKMMTFLDAKKIGDSVFLVKEITPKCGWQNFADSLAYYEILTLPTQYDIKGFEHKAIMDGDAVSFEIATRTSYRILGYGNPSVYKYRECKMVTGFLNMLQQQFSEQFKWEETIFSK